MLALTAALAGVPLGWWGSLALAAAVVALAWRFDWSSFWTTGALALAVTVETALIAGPTIALGGAAIFAGAVIARQHDSPADLGWTHAAWHMATAAGVTLAYYGLA